ncbi:hypothetical protein C0J52_01079 [Blattella germanica]|nr:hypothetical protein C0J52_01079 [Blattella germanica]
MEKRKAGRKEARKGGRKEANKRLSMVVTLPVRPDKIHSCVSGIWLKFETTTAYYSAPLCFPKQEITV